MNSFWLTPATLKELYGNDFKSVPSFGIIHISEILIVAIVSYVLYKYYRTANKNARHKVQIVLTILMWIVEIWKYIFTLATGQWLWNYLPLHLCSINIFVCTFHTLTNSDKLKDYLYALNLPGALLALFVAPWLTAPLFNAMHLHSYIIHGLLINYALLMLAEGYQPKIKRIPLNALYTVIIAIPIYFINQKLDTNFFYISKPNEIIITKILYTYLGDYYLLGFAVVAILIWLLMYLPWWLKERKNHV